MTIYSFNFNFKNLTEINYHYLKFETVLATTKAIIYTHYSDECWQIGGIVDTMINNVDLTWIKTHWTWLDRCEAYFKPYNDVSKRFFFVQHQDVQTLKVATCKFFQSNFHEEMLFWCQFEKVPCPFKNNN
jgi:hypothetical protein